MFSKLAIAKTAVRCITVAGSSKVVHDIVQNNTTMTSTTDQVKIIIGSVVLASMIGERVSQFTDAKMDEAVALFTSAKEASTAA